MGGSFTKSVGTFVTKNLDPLHQVGLGKYSAKLRKVIDPLNIMDPLNVLPTSGGKWLTVDKNYGAPLMNFISPKQNSFTPMTKGLPSNAQYFQQQQQMLQNFKANADSDIARRQTSNTQLASSNPAIAPTPTQVNQNSNQIESQAINQTPNVSMSNLAQTKINDTTMPSDFPIDLKYKPTAANSKIPTANTFSLPDMSSIKFGGV